MKEQEKRKSYFSLRYDENARSGQQETKKRLGWLARLPYEGEAFILSCEKSWRDDGERKTQESVATTEGGLMTGSWVTGMVLVVRWR